MANPATNFEDLTPIRSGVDLERFFLVTIDAYAAHAPNHVTTEEGVKSSYIVITLDLNLPVHCTTIKRRLLLSRPMFKKFLSPVEIEPKMAVLGEIGGSKRYILVSQPPKSTSLRGTTSFNVFCFKISAHVGGSLSQEPQKIAESLCPKGCEITHAQKRHP